jgi:FAD/FMN-containing dehydrogenase
MIEKGKVAALQARFSGQLLRPGDATYDRARRVWNTMIDRRPGLIARCAHADDIRQAVTFARTNHLLLAVRGGGHNVTGHAVCEGGMVIDLSPMKGLRVDPLARSARAEPGLTWGEFDAAAQAYGLATTGGIVSSTGIAGLTLGGGQGWLMRTHGLACDNLLAVDLVTAEGECVTASATENPELFWGVRGGGGNFGVVTAFTYQLHPVGPTVFGGLLLYPLTAAREVLRLFREVMDTAPDAFAATAVLTTSPGDQRTPVLAMAVCCLGPPAQGEQLLRPFRACRPLLADLVGRKPYTAVQTMLDATNQPGRWYYKSGFLQHLSTEAIEAMLACCARFPSHLSRIVIEAPSGAVARVGETATAYQHRHGHYNVIVISGWTVATDDASNTQWVLSAMHAMQPFALARVYVNYLDADEGSERVRAAYGANYSRLVALKNRYDPTNLFCLNHNIVPSGDTAERGAHDQSGAQRG